MGNFGLSIGFLPKFSVGYDITRKTKLKDDSKRSDSFEGYGGINKAYIGLGYEIMDFRIGVNTSYLFGKYTNNKIYATDKFSLYTKEVFINNLTGVQFDIGAQYTFRLNENINLNLGSTYTFKTPLKGKESNMIYTYTKGASINLETDKKYALKEEKDITTHIPTNMGLGFSLSSDMKWLIGFNYEKYNSVNMSFFDRDKEKNVSYGDYHKLSIGGHYIPDITSLTNFFEKVTYKAGAHYTVTPLILNDQTINDIGAFIGFGIPFGKSSISRLDLGFEVNVIGNQSDVLIRETHYNVKIGISLNDKWFIEKKYY
ncbi:putative outer membrane protein [Ichthyobacterium seriolicida]|uniref:Putative outer membrane protein n=2 Tax=Ichthyobacterium seriolicida TaxID=242600 RepID=A0A1J1E5M7_9FLAO|nr:putative outer membrane protein [Ichthyobacterium seriolicida]